MSVLHSFSNDDNAKIILRMHIEGIKTIIPRKFRKNRRNPTDQFILPIICLTWHANRLVVVRAFSGLSRYVGISMLAPSEITEQANNRQMKVNKLLQMRQKNMQNASKKSDPREQRVYRRNSAQFH